MAATGYTANSFTAGEVPTTTIWNQLWNNDASFNNGQGINDAALVSRHYSNNSVLKAALEKPHYNAMWFSANNGFVFSNTQVGVPFTANDTANANGVTITGLSTNAASFIIARNGIYTVDFTGQCIDVNANDLIVWIYIQPGGTGSTYPIRREYGGVAVSNGFSLNHKQYLTASTVVTFNLYNAGGNTRFGTSQAAGSYPQEASILGLGATIAEIR